MLKAVVRGLIAQGQQEMVLLIVPSAEKLSGFGNELLVAGKVLVRDFKLVRTFRDHINYLKRLLTRRRELYLAIVQSGDQRRVHQAVESDRLKINGVAGLATDVKRRSEFPALRQAH